MRIQSDIEVTAGFALWSQDQVFYFAPSPPLHSTSTPPLLHGSKQPVPGANLVQCSNFIHRNPQAFLQVVPPPFSSQLPLLRDTPLRGQAQVESQRSTSWEPLLSICSNHLQFTGRLQKKRVTIMRIEKEPLIMQLKTIRLRCRQNILGMRKGKSEGNLGGVRLCQRLVTRCQLFVTTLLASGTQLFDLGHFSVSWDGFILRISHVGFLGRLFWITVAKENHHYVLELA